MNKYIVERFSAAKLLAQYEVWADTATEAEYKARQMYGYEYSYTATKVGS